MFLDHRTVTISNLIEEIAALLAYQGLPRITTAYDAVDLQPTTTATHHAAAAAVHVLLAHDAGTTLASATLDEIEATRLKAATNGKPKNAAGAGDHQSRRQSQNRPSKKSSSTKTTKKSPSKSKCEICGRPFTSATYLQRHIEKAHPDAATAPAAE